MCQVVFCGYTLCKSLLLLCFAESDQRLAAHDGVAFSYQVHTHTRTRAVRRPVYFCPYWWIPLFQHKVSEFRHRDTENWKYLPMIHFIFSWPFWRFSPIFGLYVYLIFPFYAIFVFVYVLGSEPFGFGQPTISFVNVSYLISHCRHLKGGWPGSSTWSYGVTTHSPQCSWTLQLSPGVLKQTHWIKPKHFANLISICFSCCVFLPIIPLLLYSSYTHNFHCMYQIIVRVVYFNVILRFVRSCCIGGFAFFCCGSFVHAFYSGFCFFSATRQSLLSQNTDIFAALWHFEVFLSCEFNLIVPANAQPFLQPQIK